MLIPITLGLVTHKMTQIHDANIIINIFLGTESRFQLCMPISNPRPCVTYIESRVMPVWRTNSQQKSLFQFHVVY